MKKDETTGYSIKKNGIKKNHRKYDPLRSRGKNSM
jgi:hypothetical protein